MPFVKKHPAGLVSFSFSLIFLLVACSSTSQIPQTSTPIATTPSRVLSPTAQKPQPTGTLTPGYGGGTGWIAFGCNPDPTHSQNDICVSKFDGSGMRQLTHSLVNQASLTPVWSPDGKKIAFSSNSIHVNGRDDFDIYVMNVDGSGVTRLTTTHGNDGVTSWSPDSKRLAFYSYRDGHPEVYVMNADGSSQTRLTRGPVNSASSMAYWSPDGTKILYTYSSDTNETSIYVMNADGSGQTKLMDVWSGGGNAVWQP